MPNRSTDSVFQLIHSLEKSEKRNFKLYVQRNSSNSDMKIIQIFDAMGRMTHYDEGQLLKKLPSIKKQQLSNIKAHLYRQLLASLRILKSEVNIDILLHEQLDYARILYNKGLYMQSLKILDKIKELAASFYQDSFLIQIISLEKKIETLHITRSMQDRADRLSMEANEVNDKRQMITALSNLALQLYSWYIKNGHARNANDEEGIKKYFKENLPALAFLQTGFYERLYLYQSYCWFSFIRQDFLMYYRYTQKWVNLFYQHPAMINFETASYIKGMHNLLNAHFDLRNYEKFEMDLKRFEKFTRSETVSQHTNNRIQSFVYLNIAKINQHFMLGSFSEGLKLVPYLEEKLSEYELYLDRHRVLVFYYKIANLYFGSGDPSTSIDYLQRIIQWKVDLRNDLQCYARLVHLIAHYELGNTEILEYLTKSVYRFMAKMQNLTMVEEAIFFFLRSSFHLSIKELKPAFEKLLNALKRVEKDRFATRAFAYLDIISWLESKIYEKSMADIIRERYLKHRKRHYKEELILSQT
jgi:hypothetical protein